MTNDQTTARDDAYDGRALVAVFGNRETAHAVARELHDEGFRRTWLGVTRQAQTASLTSQHDPLLPGTMSGATRTTVETADGDDSVMEKIGRFFAGESGEKTLYDELVRHGVAQSEAQRIEASLPPDTAILTVDGHNHPELVAEIIERGQGHILAGEAFDMRPDDKGEPLAASSTLRGSDVLGYGTATEYARGEQIDAQRRLELREERLTIEKQQVSAGEAHIGKDVVEHDMQVDVPTMREELFIERRPVTEASERETNGAAIDAGAITGREMIRVPLMREQILVTKRPVVTEELVIGKRQVVETQHVAETTREERLRVDDSTPGAR